MRWSIGTCARATPADTTTNWAGYAVAHGADFLGLSAKVGAATPSEVLQPIAYRLVHDEAWVDQESARVARAVLEALRGIDVSESTTWLDTVNSPLDNYESNPPSGRQPAWPGNVFATVTALLLALGSERNGVDDRVAEKVRPGLAAIAHRITPWLFSDE